MIQSVTFWVVLAIAALVHWCLPSRWRMGFIALVSAGYLASLSGGGGGVPVWGVVLGLSVWIALFHWLCHRVPEEHEARDAAEGSDSPPPQPSKRSFHALLIVGVFGQLAYFKYIPPLIDALAGNAVEAHVLVPLGMSFFSFKLVHYGIEVARGNVPERSLASFAAYMFLFPIFTAGPIERYDHFLAGRQDRLRLDDVVFALTRIIHGLVKKMVVADMLVAGLMRGNDATSVLAGLEALPAYKVGGFLFLMFAYLYFDFSAYSDIGIGASRLFGLKIGENFNFPFVASNINDFWKRWHISLSGWCQAYVYLPTLGLTRNPYLAVTSTFLVMGLWHAGSVTRIVWGLYHAAGIIAFTRWSKLKRKNKWKHLDRAPWKYGGVPITWAFLAGSAAFLAVENAGQGMYGALRLVAKLLFIDLPA